MYDPDSDVQWGLNFFDVDQIFSSTYYGDSSQHDINISHEQYSYYGESCDNIENDEIIAHALQEELSHLSVAEESLPSHGEEEHVQGETSDQEYHCPSTGHDHVTGEIIDVEHSSSCSSPGNDSYDGDECTCDLEITDEFSLDGEVGKRLNEMVPIPHVPKINGDIPSFDEATSDHERLLNRLQYYGLVERKIQGDGNCQFRALSDQFYRTSEHHKFVRQQIVSQLKSHSEIYEGYVPMGYTEYLKKMAKSGEWGDHVTLQAAADSYGVKILVITSFKDTCYIEILPKFQKSKRVIFLSFWAEVHYNSIYPQGELPPCDYKRKKKWWRFGNKDQNSFA